MQNHWDIWPSKGKRKIIADNYEMAQGKNKKNVEKDGGGRRMQVGSYVKKTQ